MGKRGKRYRAAFQLVDRTRLYPPEEAIALAKKTATSKFDETIEVAINLGIDPRKSDQAVRGVVVLPHGTGKVPKVAVLAEGEAAQKAKEAGADWVGGEDLVKQIENGWEEFDVLVSTPEMMRFARRLGKILGPRMPSKKSGTITSEPWKVVQELKSGRVEFRNDRGGNLHCPIGKASFEEGKLVENFYTLLGAVLRAQPPTLRGTYIRTITISSTMGPGIKVDTRLAIEKAREYAAQM